ncbi:MAG: sulfatase [Bryobacteraceae bacterium]
MSTTTRRNLLRGAGALAGLAGIPGGAAAAAPQPGPDAGSHWERPPKQSGNNLNVILLVSDTFRADNLAAYGSQWVECPNLNRFAEQAIIFEDAYPEGMPTIPIRRQLYTGRRIIPTYYYQQPEPVQLPGWHHLYNEDVTLSEVLTEAGYTTALIADLPHLQRPGRNFHKGFGHYDWVRGQEVDYYGQAPRKQPDFLDLYPAEYLNQPELSIQFGRGQDFRAFLNQYTANRKRWLQDGNSLVEQTARKAIAWLNENHQEGPFFLHVEAFDPHEPWDPPVEFLEKYMKQPGPHSWPEPPYSTAHVPPEGIARLRANYAGEASNVDHWYGKILSTAAELGLLENSVVIFMSDHGALLGEQGQFVKGPERLRKQVTHIPLLVKVPGNQFAGKRVPGFVQIPDIAPTILGRLDLKPPSRVTGQDLWPYVTGQRGNTRDHVVQAYGWIAAVRTPDWNYSAIWNREKYVGEYKPQLYDRKKDPDELKTVADDNPAVVRELHTKLEQYIASGWGITNGSFNEKAG